MVPAASDPAGASHEKHRVALTSLLAAVLLTGTKLTVGLMTGSLGILSEAAHSGLDLVAAAMTFFAVRVSSRPADGDHPYGHGKVENLSAFFETLLLLVTCVWIIWEAIQRLFFKEVQVEVTVWAFAVMGLSIVVDASRSRALSRVAKKYDSQALEADALHFSTDIWSSSVVILGLVLLIVSAKLRQPWLRHADAGAALAVAAIVVVVSVQLGRRTIAGLLDAVPSHLVERVREVVRVPGVVDVGRVRIRRSGPEAFADVTLTVSREISLERSHDIASEVEEAVRTVLPSADVVVHVDPVAVESESILTTVRIVAARQRLGAHAIRIYEVRGSTYLDMHLEVDESLNLGDAHAQATALERALHDALPAVAHIVTHLEPSGASTNTRAAQPGDAAEILSTLRSLVRSERIDCLPHDVQVHHLGGELSVSFHCSMSPGAPIIDAHALSDRLEKLLRARMPKVGRVVIHVEPPDPD
jgi:cation diffusion facilitator family transporter